MDKQCARSVGKLLVIYAILVAVALVLGGCNRVVVVPYGKPVMVMETIEVEKLGVKGPDGKIIIGKGVIHAGWIAAPLLDE